VKKLAENDPFPPKTVVDLGNLERGRLITM